MKISKSLSLKCNLGNYTMADFFVSAEAECNESEMYQAGQSLHEYCKKELTKDVNATKKYLQDLANGKVEEKNERLDYIEHTKEYPRASSVPATPSKQEKGIECKQCKWFATGSGSSKNLHTCAPHCAVLLNVEGAGEFYCNSLLPCSKHTPSDPATELADGEWNVPTPKRNDNRV